MGENLCKQSNQQGINLQNIQTSQKKKKKKPNQKKCAQGVPVMAQRKRIQLGTMRLQV